MTWRGDGPCRRWIIGGGGRDWGLSCLFFFFLERKLIDHRDRQTGLMVKNDRHANAGECRRTLSKHKWVMPLIYPLNTCGSRWTVPSAIKMSLWVELRLRICSHLSGCHWRTFLNITCSCIRFNCQTNDTQHIFAALLISQEELPAPNKYIKIKAQACFPHHLVLLPNHTYWWWEKQSDGLHSVWPRADEKAQSHISDNGVIAVS